jgi:hypothetical protein
MEQVLNWWPVQSSLESRPFDRFDMGLTQTRQLRLTTIFSSQLQSSYFYLPAYCTCSEPQFAQANNLHPQYATTRAVSNPAIKRNKRCPPSKQQLTKVLPSCFDFLSTPWKTPEADAPKMHKMPLHCHRKYSFSFDKPLLLRVIHIPFPSTAAAASLVKERKCFTFAHCLLTMNAGMLIVPLLLHELWWLVVWSLKVHY